MNVTDLTKAFQALERAGSAAALRRLVAKCVRQMEFEHFAYVSSWGTEQSRRQLLVSDYPSRWIEHYVQQGYLAIDPTLRHVKTSLLPCVWDEYVDDRDAARFWDEARWFGLTNGLTVAVSAPLDAPGPAGLLSLCRDRPLDMTGLDLARLMGRAQMFATLVHHTLCRLKQHGLKADLGLQTGTEGEARAHAFVNRRADARYTFDGIGYLPVNC